MRKMRPIGGALALSMAATAGAQTDAAEPVSGLSAIHAQYLADGGRYYSARLFPGFFAAFDLQHVANPAYNQDRGPVWVSSLRLHFELGKDAFRH